MREVKQELEYKGLDCKGYVVFGDQEGDPSVPGGVHTLPPYVLDLEVDSGGHSIYDMLTEEAKDEIINVLIDATRE